MIQIFIFKLTLSRFLNSFKIFLKSVPPNFIWLSCWIESLSLQIFYYKKKKKKKQIKNFFFGIAKSCIHLHPVPPTSIQPISAPTQLHPQRYTNQNIARNWEISPNLDRKIQSYPFCLKIGTHCIFEVMIPNLNLGFQKSNPKIYFWVIWAEKSNLSALPENWYTEYLKDADSYFGISFLNFQHWFYFGVNLGRKSRSCTVFLIFIPTLVFWNPKHK